MRSCVIACQHIHVPVVYQASQDWVMVGPAYHLKSTQHHTVRGSADWDTTIACLDDSITKSMITGKS